jgi:RNA polymerase sigma-70 factor, ECF subfamily
MTPPEQHDEGLMALVAQGRRDCLERLVRRHATPLLSFLHRLCGDRHRAEELFQETFLAVWTKRHRYEFPRPFKPWLFAIALNKFRAERRARPDPAPLGTAVLPDADVPPDAAAEADETARLVGRAVRALPPRQREVVTLRVWHGLPYSRIAEVVGCPEATARSHMHLALAALRRELEGRLGAGAGEGVTR